MKAVKLLFGALSLLLLSSQSLADAPTWGELTPQYQELLSDFQEKWEDLPADRREKLLHRAESWQQLPPDCREALLERWRELRDLPPEVRGSLRERWQSMSASERRDAMQARPHKVRCQQGG